jgi:uncharacterized membrane protein YphA (DoxX/SURF4 family)
VQRLFSTFPCGLPGAGLLLLRTAIAAPLVYSGVIQTASAAPAIIESLAAVAATLLLVGLWTPLAGGVIAIVQFGLALSQPANPWTFVHFGILAIAIALLGPGGCSVDARLFGRKQIHLPPR